MHIALEDAVFDENGVVCQRALVVKPHRQRRGLAEGGVGKVHQVHKLRADPFVEQWARHRAALDQICLDGVPHGLVGQHAGHHAAQNHRASAGLGIDALFFCHQVLIERLDLGVAAGHVGELVVKASGAAKGLEQLKRGAIPGLGVEDHIDIAAGTAHMTVAAVGAVDDLVHGVLIIDNAAAGQIRVGFGDMVVDLAAGVDQALLVGVMDLHGAEHRALLRQRTHAEPAWGVGVQEFCVFCGGAQNPAGGLDVIFRHSGEAGHTVFQHLSAQAPGFAALVVHQNALLQADAAHPGLLAAEDRLDPGVKKGGLRLQNVLQHDNLLVCWFSPLYHTLRENGTTRKKFCTLRSRLCCPLRPCNPGENVLQSRKRHRLPTGGAE